MPPPPTTPAVPDTPPHRTAPHPSAEALRSIHEMNSYADTLRAAKSEIDSFAMTEAGRKWDSDWYDRLKERIDQAIAAPGDDAAEQLLDSIGWIIVDSGPLEKGFSDSVEKVLDSMQRARKRRAKAGRGAGKDGEKWRG